MNGGHAQGGVGSAATAILFRAIKAGALAALDADFFGDGLVVGNLLFDGFDHATFATLGVTLDIDFLCDDVISTGFDLAGFCPISGGLAMGAKHGTAG